MVFKYNMNKIYSTFLLLLYQLNKINSIDYVSIPFKINYIDNNQFTSLDSQISELISNKIIFPLKIGHPLQDIYGTINSLEFELLLKKSDYLFNKRNFFFNKTNSDSFNILEKSTSSYLDLFDSFYVNDFFNFCVKYDIKNKKCEKYNQYKINFIFMSREDMDGEEYKEKTKNSYIEIGLNLKTHFATKYSLFNELFDNKYISSNTWFIYYFPENENENKKIKKNEEDDGIIIYGENPINFFPEKYNSSSIAYTQGMNKNYDYGNYWSLIFNEVKMKSLKSNDEIIFGNNIQGVINHNYNAIVGSQQYMDSIENNFFNFYLSEGFCKKNLLNDKFYYYVCNSNLLSMNQIKNSFPNLYLKNIDFNYIFELTAEDLFITKGDNIFFLVVFNKKNPTESFSLGKIFLKKYLFYFDNDKTQIAFVQENNKNKNNINKEEGIIIVHWYNSPGTVIVLIILLIIIGLTGFYYGRKIYNKRKLLANELEDDYEYKSPKDKNKGSKFNLEMKLAFD